MTETLNPVNLLDYELEYPIPIEDDPLFENAYQTNQLNVNLVEFSYLVQLTMELENVNRSLLQCRIDENAYNSFILGCQFNDFHKRLEQKKRLQALIEPMIVNMPEAMQTTIIEEALQIMRTPRGAFPRDNC